MMETLSQMIGMVQAANNPMQAVNQMAANDPRMQQVMEIVNQNGGDAKAAFYNMARQRGVDPNAILNQLKGLQNQNGSKFGR